MLIKKKKGDAFSFFYNSLNLNLLTTIVFFVEFFNITTCVNNLFLSCVEWVTFVADINFDCIAFNTRTCLEGISTSTSNCYFVIIWVNTFFHFSLLLVTKIWKQCHISCSLNSCCKFSLVMRANTCLASWQNFTFFCDIFSYFCNIFIVDCFFASNTESTNFLFRWLTIFFLNLFFGFNFAHFILLLHHTFCRHTLCGHTVCGFLII